MQYDGFTVGPRIRDLRRKSDYTLEELSEKTGISTSTIKRIEQGNRPLSMKNLYSIMEAFKVDANTVLSINPNKGRYSIDERLSELDDRKREYFFKVFSQMLDQAEVSFA
jgi:transcriptional regulator with XRE-family HTH domain